MECGGTFLRARHTVCAEYYHCPFGSSLGVWADSNAGNIFGHSQTFIESGFSNALIQKKDRTEIDFSTVFYFNIVVSLVVYLILFSPLLYCAIL
mgnify:CR=1 FL=1